MHLKNIKLFSVLFGVCAISTTLFLTSCSNNKFVGVVDDTVENEYAVRTVTFNKHNKQKINDFLNINKINFKHAINTNEVEFKFSSLDEYTNNVSWKLFQNSLIWKYLNYCDNVGIENFNPESSNNFKSFKLQFRTKNNSNKTFLLFASSMVEKFDRDKIASTPIFEDLYSFDFDKNALVRIDRENYNWNTKHYVMPKDWSNTGFNFHNVSVSSYESIKRINFSDGVNSHSVVLSKYDYQNVHLKQK